MKAAVSRFGIPIRQPVAIVLCFALFVQLVYARLSVEPFWGDVYHHWLISQLTLDNGWVYSDYKGLELIWLPVYHYLVAIVMAITGRGDLAPAQWLNQLQTILTSGIVTAFVYRHSKSRSAALLAGITFILLPWSLAYSHLNMPETLAGLLLLLLVRAAYQPKTGILFTLALISALTRHELTALVAVVCIWLVWRRQWRATIALGAGAAIGIALWSWWSWHLTGDVLAWWTRYRAATAWDALFVFEAGFRPNITLATLHTTLQQAFPPLTITAIATALGLTYPTWRKQMHTLGWLPLLLVGAHWLMIGVILRQNLPSADPRYVLISMPLAVVASTLIIVNIPRRKTRWLLGSLQLIWVVVAAYTQLPTFADKQYGLTPELAAGRALAELATEDGMLWVDSPTAIYASGLPLRRFVSSDRLVPNVVAGGRDGVVSAEILTQHAITHILWQPVSYNYVPILLPQMANSQPFEQSDHQFTPVYTYEGWELDYGAKQTILWQVSPSK